ncbi:3-phosphoshikimate 1-carboxyvinyltransferase, partial [bacterium]|nr:3-phosphoshikimate 1-carboxyvinyltransferase [bacterium]
MRLRVERSSLRGSAAMPGSKSHTIRAIILGALAEGESYVRRPLDSLDTRAAVTACQAFGAEIDTCDPECWVIAGTGGNPRIPADVVDVGNSGTTLYVVMSTAALCRDGWTVLTGDSQIRRRPAASLIAALRDLGADIFSTRGNDLCPLLVRGPLKGGKTSIEAIT